MEDILFGKPSKKSRSAALVLVLLVPCAKLWVALINFVLPFAVRCWLYLANTKRCPAVGISAFGEIGHLQYPALSLCMHSASFFNNLHLFSLFSLSSAFFFPCHICVYLDFLSFDLTWTTELLFKHLMDSYSQVKKKKHFICSL